MRAVELARQAAHVGAEVLLTHWGRLGKKDADLKARHDWVSRADRESEQAIISFLREQSGGEDAFIGEESGSLAEQQRKAEESRRTWIIDPLDGTSNYLQHFPFWSVSIGAREKGVMVAGAIYEPLRDQMFTAERGSGAFLNDQRMRVSEQKEIEGSFLATGFPFRAQDHVETYCAIFQDVIRLCKGVRRAGSAALDLAYTAAGVFDGFFELHLAPWDVAAGSLMVEEAGGLITDFSGGDRYWERGNIVGAGAAVHRGLMELIARHTDEASLERRGERRV